ncbi:hypothetical protein V493_02128 [Pseudogymnoascus sp. VKM F-4281 (FW-2241)]|nr:hypothetical protein V493_02128 [Pseudogymnoascus sp. VKM F-4281 (FW-2241)]
MKKGKRSQCRYVSCYRLRFIAAPQSSPPRVIRRWNGQSQHCAVFHYLKCAPQQNRVFYTACDRLTSYLEPETSLTRQRTNTELIQAQNFSIESPSTLLINDLRQKQEATDTEMRLQTDEAGALPRDAAGTIAEVRMAQNERIVYGHPSGYSDVI